MYRDSSQPDEVQQVAAERVRLLTLKHSGMASDEDLLQLETLNHRMSELCPRVTPAQLQALEEAKQLLEDTRRRMAERNDRLGLNKP